MRRAGCGFGVRAVLIGAFVVALAGCGSDSAPDNGGESSAGLRLGDSRVIEDGDERFELTPKRMRRDGRYVKLDVTVTGMGSEGYDTTGLSMLSTLFAGDHAYDVDDFPSGNTCEAMSATLVDGRTLEGCLSFEVPESEAADAFQYDPLFDDQVIKWSLR